MDPARHRPARKRSGGRTGAAPSHPSRPGTARRSRCASLERELIALYPSICGDIAARLAEFANVWDRAGAFELFSELVFCLLTPGSKARSASRAVSALTETGLLAKGTAEQISPYLNVVRFKNTKARRLVQARERFMGRGREGLRAGLCRFPTVFEKREWLVAEVGGMGYKEASHFLRNVGMGEHVAILDRHVLKNLSALGLIGSAPQSLSRKRYLEVEEAMRLYARSIAIPLSHLDFLLWYWETGEIFK